MRVVAALCVVAGVLGAAEYESVFAQKTPIDTFFYEEAQPKSSFLQRWILEETLGSSLFKNDLQNQLGVFFAPDSYEITSIANDSMAQKLGLHQGDQVVGFGGVELMESSRGPMDEVDNAKKPSFMLTIRREGDTLKLGAGVKDIRGWGEDFLRKYSPKIAQ
jgi:predicted metalloprotease with PDZ domain